MNRRRVASIAALAATLFVVLWVAARANDTVPNSRLTAEAAADTKKAAFVQALRPKTKLPVIAIVALNKGTETTDFLIPFTVLQRSGVAHVVAVALRRGHVSLVPALEVHVETDFDTFERNHPKGADYVFVPAMHQTDDPEIIAWIKAQAGKGAVIIGICSGAQVLGSAGLLNGRQITGHWYDRNDLLKQYPTASHAADQRYLFDKNVVTTTGVTASIPVSLALVEAIGGAQIANTLADQLGVANWGPEHDSAAFGLGWSEIWTVIKNTVLFWRHETVEIEINESVDPIQLALAADAWSRTYRSSAIASAASSKSIKLGKGLMLLPTQRGQPKMKSVSLALSSTQKPGCQLEQTLDDIEERYGNRTGAFVAKQIEYGPLNEKQNMCKRPRAAAKSAAKPPETRARM